VSAWDGQTYGEVSIISKFIIDRVLPQISHFRVTSAASGQSQDIPATIIDNVGVQSALIYYRAGGSLPYASVAMTNIGDAYEGTIPGDAITVRGAEYYFSAADSAGNIRTFPTANAIAKPQTIQVTNINLSFPNPTPVKAYRMISIPFEVNDKSIESVLGDDFLGSYDQIQWRLLRFVNGANVEFGAPGFANFDFKAGLGFWLITRDAKLLDAGAGRSVTTAQNYVITLPPGWSQIGNPFAFTVNWSDVIKGSDVENRLVGYQGTLNEATGYDYTRMQLVPFEGYFVNNKGSSPTTIEVPPKASTGGAAAKSMVDGKSALQGNEWVLQFTASSDRYLDKDNYIGCLNGASDEWDPNDFSEAPFFDQHVALYFPHSEWKKYPDLYTGDFRAVKSEGDYWNFVVKSEIATPRVAKSEVILRLADVQNTPADWQIILLDKASRVAIDFGENKQYTFLSDAGKTVREFRIVVGKKDFVETNDLNLDGMPQNFVLTQNYPNPFNPETRINYELPSTSQVKIAVYNLQGQLVRVLFDEQQSAGRYTVSWDGTNTTGNRAASGVYLARMEAGKFTAMKKIVLAK